MFAQRLSALWPWLVLALASAGRAQGVSAPTQVDSLVTAAQVQQFVRAQASPYASYKEFIVTDSPSQECASALTCLAPGGRVSWLKADFDGNGRTDLLVTGYPSSRSHRWRVTCFLNQSPQKIQVLQLLSQVYGCAAFQPVRVKKGAAIRYAHFVLAGGYEVTGQPARFRIDTLIFNKTQFVEYNRTPRDYRIQQVTFSATQCLGICPVFSLQINQKGVATYRAGKHNKQEGGFSATIEAAPLRELWDLLNYIDFPNLEDSYAIGATDHPTYTLTITYANGKVKAIKDCGGEGTFGLSRAYSLLFALRTTQAWK